MDVKFNEFLKRPLTREELIQLNKSDLVELVSVYQNREGILTQTLQGAVGIAEKLAEVSIAVSKRLSKMLDLLFGGSLKSRIHSKSKERKPKKLPKNGKLLPSERYPNLPIIDQEIAAEHAPQCNCGHCMSDSGMRETSERMECKPKQYYILRHHKVIYTCRRCHAGIATAPSVPQIIPGSCYGDSFVKDVILSKLCDLIPITRYVAIAARHGVEDIPANSLHEFARHLAIYLGPAYARLTDDIKRQLILFADETRHRMLEGSEKKTWYLWSFNGDKGVVYRLEDTRASVVAERFLLDADCRYLMSDAYSGYYRALLVINKMRTDVNPDSEIILPVFCNAHARNKFCESAIKNTKPAKYMRWIYSIIFASYPEYLSHDETASENAKNRMIRGFQIMDRIADRQLSILSSNSMLHEAFAYFYKYSQALALFLTDKSIPMHNNQSERSLRNHVVGRKTWYGTHSPDIARDLVKIASLVESCKMLKVNPRAYVDDAVERVHKRLPALSPYEYQQLITGNSS
jgi:transposase